MPRVWYPAHVVANPSTLLPLTGAAGATVSIVIAETDTKVTLTDSNGVPMPNPLTVSPQGVLSSFWVEEGFTHVQAVSGSWRLDLRSADGLEMAAEAAVASAEAAQLAAEAARDAALDAAEQAEVLPGGGSTGQVLTKASPADGDVHWTTPAAGGGGGGVTDHGALSGLDDDDHPHYLTAGRGDARYYTKTQVDTAVAAAATQESAADRNRANHSGSQPVSSVTGLESRLQALEAGGGGGGGGVTVDTLSGATDTGKALMKATSKANARAAIDAGMSNVVIGTTAGTAADAAAVASALGQKADATATATALNGKSPVGHTHVAADITDLDDTVEPIVAGLASELGDQAVARTVYGSQDGEILSPWNTVPAIGPERWLTANMHASGAQVLAPTLTANGSPQELIVYLKMDGFNNGGLDPWRLELDFAAPASGWASMYVAVQASNQTNLAGTADQYIVTHESPARSGHVVIDFQVPDYNAAFTYLKLRLKMENNVTAGQVLSATNVSLRRIPRLAPPMLVTYGFSPGAPTVWMRHTNSRGVRKTTKTLLNAGGLASTLEYDTWNPWRWSLPDPSFIDATGVYDGKVGSDETKTAIVAGDLNVGNNDQILSVETSTPGVFELRGNVHGGEDPVTTAYKIDEGKGAGLVPWTPGSALGFLRPCRRYQVQWDTKLTRTGDSTPFANVAHLTTVFDDGMMRTDRTTTFPKAAVIGDNFEWMSSHKLSPLWRGRIGKGQTVIADVDTRNLIPPLTGVGGSASTTGGTLAAGTRYYVVTALTPFGETTISNVQAGTTTGTTGSYTVGWTPASGSSGSRIYRGNSASGPFSWIGDSTSGTFVDTGAVTPQGWRRPPTVNTAYGTTPTRREATATDATWSVWYDPDYDLCYANIFDRDALLSRPGVQAATTRLQMIPGSITKEYINAIWQGNSGTIPVGPSTPPWAVTHWSYIYSPNDPVNFHREVADKAANLGALKAMYPAT